MAHGRHRWHWIAASSLAFVAASLPAQTPAERVQTVVDRISVESYRALLNPSVGELLYTNAGDDRDAGRLDTGFRPTIQHDLARDNIASLLAGYCQGPNNYVYMDPFSFTKGGDTYTGQQNIIGVRRGTDEADQGIYVLGCHYDSWANPGANDNASGVAAVLEVARAFSSAVSGATIVFAFFDAEEKFANGTRLPAGGTGTYFRPSGSGHWVENHLKDSPVGLTEFALSRVRGMIALDTIGHSENNSLWFWDGGQGRDALVNQVMGAISDYSGLSTQYRGKGTFSDHYSFFAGAGIPSVGLLETDWQHDPNWHQPGDSLQTIGNVDYVYGASVAKGAAAYVATVADITGFSVVPLPSALAAGLASGLPLLLLARRRRG